MKCQHKNEIRNLDDYENTMYILCNQNDSMWNLQVALDEMIEDKNPNCRKIFIDEITQISSFIAVSSVLGDAYAARGIKLVLSGTDSLGFILAESNEKTISNMVEP